MPGCSPTPCCSAPTLLILTLAYQQARPQLRRGALAASGHAQQCAALLKTSQRSMPLCQVGLARRVAMASLLSLEMHYLFTFALH